MECHEEMSKAVLFHRLPVDLATNAIEFLETNQVILRSSVKSTRPSYMGTEMYLASEAALEKAVLFGAVTVFGTSYNIYPLVTDLTVHGARAHMTGEELKNRMQRLRTVLFVYEEKGTRNYRVIIHHPEIPEKVQEWPKSSDVIFKHGFKYPITFFCRFCRSYNHPRSLCDGVKCPTGVRPKLPSPHKFETEQSVPSPCSSLREYHEYSFPSNHNLTRISKEAVLQKINDVSEEEISPTKMRRDGPSNVKKLVKDIHRQKHSMSKNVNTVINDSSVKRNLDSPINSNGTKRMKLQQTKDQKLKKGSLDSGFPSNRMQPVTTQKFSSPIQKTKESSPENLNQMKKLKHSDNLETSHPKVSSIEKRKTTHWIPMDDSASSSPRKKLASTSDAVYPVNKETKVKNWNLRKNDVKSVGNHKLNNKKGQIVLPNPSEKAKIQPNSYPASPKDVPKMSSPPVFLTKEELRGILIKVKNSIKQEVLPKLIKKESCFQQRSTVKKDNVLLKTTKGFQQGSTVKKQEVLQVPIKEERYFQQGWTENQPSLEKVEFKNPLDLVEPKFQGPDSVSTSLNDVRIEKDRVKNTEESTMKNTVTQGKAVEDGNSISKGVGNPDTGKATKVRKKSTLPITSGIMNKIIENSRGELDPSALRAFFVQVVKRKKPLDFARIYSENVHLVIWQLRCIVTDYYNGREKESKAEREVKWIKNLIERMVNATNQAGKQTTPAPINGKWEVRVKKEIPD